MGVHSAFLGPIKYSILPRMVGAELVAGNALVEMGTFLAILAGTIGGGVLVILPQGTALIAGAGLLWAALGYLSSLRIPALPPVAPELRVRSIRSGRRSRSCASRAGRARCSCRCSASRGSGSSARRS